MLKTGKTSDERAWKTKRVPYSDTGLNNYDTDTADLVTVWTSSNIKAISVACGREKGRANVKNAFHIALSSPNIWTIDSDELHV